MPSTESALASERVDLEDLFNRCLGNLELAERVLQAFEGHFEEDLDELENALRANHWEGAAQIAHRMKGASSNVAAVEIANDLSQLEESVRMEQPDSARACMRRLRDHWDRFLFAEKDFGTRSNPGH